MRSQGWRDSLNTAQHGVSHVASFAKSHLENRSNPVTSLKNSNQVSNEKSKIPKAFLGLADSKEDVTVAKPRRVERDLRAGVRDRREERPLSNRLTCPELWNFRF